MIDEKKLIDALEDDMDSLFPRVFGKVHPNDAFGLYLELKAMIDNQPKISLENKTSDNDVPDTNVGKWIPCSERLPKEGDDIIGTYDNGDGHVLVGQSVYFPQLLGKPYPLTAWMPLPPAYQGE